MKYLDEYRDPEWARRLAGMIAETATRRWVVMEVCGGQTHTLMRYGIDEMVGGQVELVHGPGCPVCVTPVEVVDKAVAIAGRLGVIFVSYGDMLRVPGTRSDLYRVKAEGGDVRVVYSPMDAVELARRNPERRVVFFGIGFETTAPGNAMAVWKARREGLTNFSMLASHVLVPPAIDMILASPGNRVQGFIGPGHVCTVTGYADYEGLAAKYRTPIVVGGFEPVDLLEAILMLVRQLEQGRCEVENQYARSVKRLGNAAAQKVVAEVFEVADRPWRGIGTIPRSGLRIRQEYVPWDAERVYEVEDIGGPEPEGCISAEVLQGRKKPEECAEFGRGCTPAHPLGAPMVSSEGACAAFYLYRRRTGFGSAA